jgi:hypothetical protein
MKNIIKISIRLFLVFALFNFMNAFSLTALNLINVFRINDTYEIQASEFIGILTPFLIIWTIDLFDNPVGCLTSLAVFQAKALQNCGFSGSCSETEGSEQL